MTWQMLRETPKLEILQLKISVVCCYDVVWFAVICCNVSRCGDLINDVQGVQKLKNRDLMISVLQWYDIVWYGVISSDTVWGTGCYTEIPALKNLHLKIFVVPWLMYRGYCSGKNSGDWCGSLLWYSMIMWCDIVWYDVKLKNTTPEDQLSKMWYIIWCDMLWYSGCCSEDIRSHI